MQVSHLPEKQCRSSVNFSLTWTIAILLLLFAKTIHGEGSKDFLDYPGYRLFFWAESQQQLKVYAAEGEFLNLGSSHIDISGGFMRVFRPDGTLHTVFDNTGATQGLAIINNHIEERNGPNGGGTTNGPGYVPGVIQVGAGEAGVWTVTLEYPNYTGSAFRNLLNSDPWDRSNQPLNKRVVLAWDITVTQSAPGNEGGHIVEGRVYSNEYNSILNRNGVTTSPLFYILTKDGFQYRVDFKDTDPWGFPIFSNTLGLVYGDEQPTYESRATSGYIRSADPASWQPDSVYLYEPQAEDYKNIINNKVFFNLPDPLMPPWAMTTDIFRNNTHQTWLFKKPNENLNVEFRGFESHAITQNGQNCDPNTIHPDFGGYFVFNTTKDGTVELQLDLDGNGVFTDAVDRVFYKNVVAGRDSVFWNGADGTGQAMPRGIGITIGYRLSLHAGEVHIMMSDIENNIGGVTITLLNDLPVLDKDVFYYNHQPIGGTISGNPADGVPRPTAQPFTYDNNFGNEKLLDYWSYVDYEGEFSGTIALNILDDCSTPDPNPLDSDNDGIPDRDDIDDDNDGIPDRMEFCNGNGGFACLPGGADPSGDADGDLIPNYLDADDPAIPNRCPDSDGDGICDVLDARYDTDGDGVPDHLDLDSDNDGISDLVEAGHQQPDTNGDGMIDGPPAAFGQNGLYNAIASHPDALTAVHTYSRYDTDNDGVPDHDDLDSDNDGINDVAEAGYASSDTNNDGRIDDGNGNIPTVSIYGLAPVIDPSLTHQPIPFPPDWDNDGVPDWHDLDSDNDGINDVREANHNDPDGDGIIGVGTPLVDTDGKATASANGTPVTTTSDPVDTDGDGIPDFHDLDADGDGIFDTHEAGLPDDDKDGILGTGTPTVNPSGQPIADENNNPLNTISNPRDLDNDGKADFQDVDRDGDGIPDAYECETGWPCPDTDGDGTVDADDLDSDGDGLPDADECPYGIPCPDDNGNNIDNFREYTCHQGNIPLIANMSGDGTICEGETIILTAVNGRVFSDSVIYTWTGPGGFSFSAITSAAGPFPLQLNNVQNDRSGIYALSLTTDRGCTSAQSNVYIEVVPTPGPPFLSVHEDEICVGETIQLNATPTSGNNIAYNWYYNDGSGSMPVATTTSPTLFLENARAVQSGIYEVEVLVDGCASNLSNQEYVTVTGPPQLTAPRHNATVDAPACEGQSVQLTADFVDGATYEWFGPAGFSAAVYNPLITDISELQSGEYFVKITKDGCSAVSPVTTIYVTAKPQQPEIDIPAPVCHGADARISLTIPPFDPTDNATVKWYRASNNELIGSTSEPSLLLQNLTIASGGMYYAVVEIDGCASEKSDNVTLEIDEIPDELAYIENDLLYSCANDELLIKAVAPTTSTGAWTSAGAAVVVQPESDATIVYDLQAGENLFIWSLSKGACRDFARDSLIVIHEENQLSASDDVFELKQNETVNSEEWLANDNTADINDWILGIPRPPTLGTLTTNPDGSVTYTPNENAAGIDNFEYRLCNTNCPNQCSSAIVTLRLEAEDQNGDCFIPNFITPDGDGANDAFIVKCLDDQFANNELMIFNRWGDKVLDESPYKNNWTGTYRNAPLPPGTYFYCLRLNPEEKPVQGYITIIR